jgi:tRNA(fMet)-specific endonuclease VapC
LILVDTDVLIEILDKDSRIGKEALTKIKKSGEEIIITSINLHEVLYGLYKYANRKKINRVMLFNVVKFGKEDAQLSAKLEVEAEKKGKKTTRLDAMIAAIAINGKFKLFTFNKKHYEMFEELTMI